jgi:hypothetical protein
VCTRCSSTAHRRRIQRSMRRSIPANRLVSLDVPFSLSPLFRVSALCFQLARLLNPTVSSLDPSVGAKPTGSVAPSSWPSRSTRRARMDASSSTTGSASTSDRATRLAESIAASRTTLTSVWTSRADSSAFFQSALSDGGLSGSRLLPSRLTHLFLLCSPCLASIDLAEVAPTEEVSIVPVLTAQTRSAVKRVVALLVSSAFCSSPSVPDISWRFICGTKLMTSAYCVVSIDSCLKGYFNLAGTCVSLR